MKKQANVPMKMVMRVMVVVVSAVVTDLSPAVNINPLGSLENQLKMQSFLSMEMISLLYNRLKTTWDTKSGEILLGLKTICQLNGMEEIYSGNRVGGLQHNITWERLVYQFVFKFNLQ